MAADGSGGSFDESTDEDFWMLPRKMTGIKVDGQLTITDRKVGSS